MSIDKAGKILMRIIVGAFHGQIKLDPEDLMGLVIPTRKNILMLKSI
jgi:hypothetical protein